MKKILLILLIPVFLLFGCSSPATDAPEPEPEIPVPATEAPAVQEPEKPEVGSLLNGLPLDEALKIRRPIAVMLDNHIGARPQAGLGEADVVVEALVEGEITRYMAVFQSQDPETIGSVRSARPYFVEMAQSYDALYVHAGGSPEALSDIRKKGVADLDSLSEGKITFWRRNHKKSPHNLYTSPGAIRNAAAARKYRTDWKGIPQTFAYDGTPQNGTPFRQVDLRFKEPGSRDKTGYTASFTVSLEDTRLARSVNGQVHADETTKAPLYADNLIIQFAAHKVLDSAGRLRIDLVGSGSGFYCNAGAYWPITWEKKAAGAMTEYRLADGTPLTMKPGILWIALLPKAERVAFH